MALCLWSLLVHLIISAAASLNTLDGSMWTAFCHVVGPHPAPSLQRRSAPAHWPCQNPAWLLFTCFLPSNLLRMCIQLSPRFVVKLPKRLHCQAWVNLFVIPINWGAFPINLLIAHWVSQSICWPTLLLLVGMLLISSGPSLSMASTQAWTCSESQALRSG